MARRVGRPRVHKKGHRKGHRKAAHLVRGSKAAKAHMRKVRSFKR